MASVEGPSRQKVSLGVQKNLEGNLAAGEQREVVQNRLSALLLQMPAITIATIRPEEKDSRKLFEFAENIRIQTIVSERSPEALPLVEKLADERSYLWKLRNSSGGQGRYGSREGAAD